MKAWPCTNVYHNYQDCWEAQRLSGTQMFPAEGAARSAYEICEECQRAKEKQRA